MDQQKRRQAIQEHLAENRAALGGDVLAGTLAEFLLARISEDEAVARAGGHGGLQWKSAPNGYDSGAVEAVDGPKYDVGTVVYDEGRPSEEQADHIARWDPARVLAECEAKRRIVAEHPIYRGPRILAVDASTTDYGCELCHCIDPIRADGIIEANGYCETLLALALPYADHPDYREEWKP